MLSFKRAIRALDQTEDRLRAWWGSYSGILSAVENAVVELSGERTPPLRGQIAMIRESLSPDTDPAFVAQQGLAAQQIVQTLAHELTEARTLREKEFKKIVWITAEAGAAMIRSGNVHAEEITQFAARVQATSCLESVVEIRCQMARRVNELNAVARRIQQDSQQNADSLNRDIRRIEERLKAAENLAETDTLTKLGNRRLLERRIAAAMEAQNNFCVVVVDLNGFKAVNDRFGHVQGDRLLQAVANALSASVRGVDLVGRWGGDEFVILMQGIDQAGAEARVAQIQKKVFGEFLVDEQGQPTRVHISACFGIAEYRSGEAADELFDRADRGLYQLKRALANAETAQSPAHNPKSDLKNDLKEARA